MTALAIVLGIVAIAAAVLAIVALRMLARLCVEVRDALHAQFSLTNGLEAALKPLAEQAAESADAACAQLDALTKRLDEVPAARPAVPSAAESPSASRRVGSAREMLAALEAESFEEAVERHAGVKRG